MLRKICVSWCLFAATLFASAQESNMDSRADHGMEWRRSPQEEL